MATQTTVESRTNNEYTVGWVCALPKEQAAAIAMLDQKHPDLPKPLNDPNAYTLGSVGKHNIVIACLPKGHVGNNPAATVATWMISTFPSIKFGLMVGIGGGVPPKVRLGDVVVSTPIGPFPGVVQWDSGKVKDGGSFERIGSLNNPPTSLLTAISKLETEYELNGPKIPEYLEELKEKWPRLVPKYLRSDSLKDILFKKDYSHINQSMDYDSTLNDDEGDEEESCRFCDQTKIVKRKPRDMRVHFGVIASGNQVIKDARFRDRLNKDLGGHVLCVEMEAAGLMNNFPCIIVRGICDYADSHKNKDWQEHAAAAAAAFSKELLGYVQPSDVDSEYPVKDILGQILDTVSGTGRGIKTLESRSEEEQDLQILSWLTPVDYGSQQSDFLKRRQPGSCQWLLDSDKYQNWLKTSNQMLFCPGIPGAGKTILTAIVVDDLCNKFQKIPSVGIAYIFCNFRRWDEQKAEHFLASLLKQLTQEQSSLPDSVKSLYTHHRSKRTRPSFDEISRALRSVAAMYSRVFIIVDALDECQAFDGCCTKLLSEMFLLQAECGANIFATSRFVPEITIKFKGSVSLEIRASSDDVRRYLDSHLSRLPRFVTNSLQLQEEIKTEIIKAVDGMFLLAQLHLDSLVGKISPKAIRAALKTLPTGSDAYDHAYEDAMERIEGQREEQKTLAKQVISWITCTKRPFTPFELQYALAVEVGTCELDGDNLTPIELILSVCAGLVTVDEENGIIRLVHYTTQEYFERTQKYWFQDAETNITKVCVTYLSFEIPQNRLHQTGRKSRKSLEFNRLYDYAAQNWGHHARMSSIDGNEFILDFLKNETRLSACSQAMLPSKMYYRNDCETQMAGLHITAYFGLSQSTEALLEQGQSPSPKDVDGWTPLHYAAENGYQEVVRVLLDKNADPNIPDGKYGGTPLHYAAENGRQEVLKLLLDKNADPNILDSRYGRTPLYYAIKRGKQQIINLLLDKAADPNIKIGGNYGQALLHYTAKSGDLEVTKLLLSRGADPNTKDGNYGQTPLHYATEKNHLEVVKLLLNRNANPNIQDSGYQQTPLHYASKKGYQEVVKLLLGKDGNPNTQDFYNQTPLHWATCKEHQEVVKLLLNNQADPNFQDSEYGRTPLHYAVDKWNQEIVKLLLNKHANPNLQDGDYSRTPLHYAAENGYQEVLRLLLDKNADPGIQDSNYGWTPLHYATEKGYQELVKLLLDRNANPNIQDSSYRRTALHFAAENGHQEVLKLLLNKDADPTTKDCYDQTPLHWAASKGHQKVLKLLLDKNADPNTQDAYNQTPLHWATAQGNQETVKLLLDAGANPNIKSNSTYSQTPLHYAVEIGNQTIVELLLANDANPNIKNSGIYGQTPLHYAVDVGSQEIVKLLLDKNANPNVRGSNYGRTPLHSAAEKGGQEIVKLLLDMDANPNIHDGGYGRTPLHYAVKEGNLDIVKLLLDKDVDPNIQDGGHSRTPLHYAMDSGSPELVKLLLSKGASPNTQDFHGQTPLHLAVGKGKQELVKLLLNEDADPDIRVRNYGQTPLHFAVANGNQGIVKLLLDMDADPNIADDQGRTPLLYATVKEHEEVVKMLLYKGAKYPIKFEDSNWVGQEL